MKSKAQAMELAGILGARIGPAQGKGWVVSHPLLGDWRGHADNADQLWDAVASTAAGILALASVAHTAEQAAKAMEAAQ